jgi:hypothetical protein
MGAGGGGVLDATFFAQPVQSTAKAVTARQAIYRVLIEIPPEKLCGSYRIQNSDCRKNPVGTVFPGGGIALYRIDVIPTWDRWFYLRG